MKFGRGPGVLPLLYVGSSLLILVLILWSQTESYAPGLLLGWDSSTYAYLARLVIQNGPSAMISTWNYPHLSVLILAGTGLLIGNLDLAERILPVLYGGTVVIGTFRLVRLTAGNVHVAGISSILTVVSLNFVRLLADLNRNLLALALIVLYVPFFVKWKTGINPTRAVVSLAWLSLVAYTQVESYVLFSLTIIILLTRSMQLRSFLTWTLLLAGPFLLELPLFVNFVLDYGRTASLTPKTATTLNGFAAFAFLGGFLIPAVAVGVAISLKQYVKRGNLFFGFWAVWSLVALAAALLPLSGILAFPPDRALYLVPVGTLSALSVETISVSLLGIMARYRSR